MVLFPICFTFQEQSLFKLYLSSWSCQSLSCFHKLLVAKTTSSWLQRSRPSVSHCYTAIILLSQQREEINSCWNDTNMTYLRLPGLHEKSLHITKGYLSGQYLLRMSSDFQILDSELKFLKNLLGFKTFNNLVSQMPDELAFTIWKFYIKSAAPRHFCIFESSKNNKCDRLWEK